MSYHFDGSGKVTVRYGHRHIKIPTSAISCYLFSKKYLLM